MGSRKRKKKQNGESAVQPARKRPWRSIWAIVLGIAVVGVAVLLNLPSGEQKAAKNVAEAMPVAATKPTPKDETPSAVSSKSAFETLKGRWQRPDGGYVVDVKSVDDNGKMDMSYFNPKRINVAKAEASRDGDATKVFIELRDVNYPGSTYNLIYEPENDQLHGIYYQAALQQQFEVVFARMN
jgi:uncharacterized protein (DUF2147 family)